MDYSTLKVTELKEELKKRNIPITKLSRKQEFIDRLLEDDAESGGAKTSDEIAKSEDAPKETATAQPDAEAAVEAAASIAEETDSSAAAITTLAVAEEPQEHVTTSAQTDENKRKRRSTSPVPSEGSVSKKLKQADTVPVHFEQDTHLPAAPQEPEAMDVDSTALPHVEPSRHAATAAIYIRDLVRPLNASQLKSHILALIGASLDDSSAMITFHIDALKTHAFVLFASASQATRARALLHGTTFPPEPTRKPLWVDFIDNDKVDFFIETERTSAGPRANDSKRWEVMYSETGEGVTAELVDVTARSLPVPTGPAAESFAPQNDEPAPARGGDVPDNADGSSRHAAGAPATAPLVLSSLALPTLHETFPSTTATPQLFFAAVPPEQVTARLNALADATSPSWDARDDHRRFMGGGRGGGTGTAIGVGGGRGLDQLRRYTFQDGAEIVDGGAEFGGGKAFGRERGGGGGGRRGGGGGGGGGRSGVPRGGDRYRGAGTAGDYDYGRYEGGAGRGGMGHGPPPPPFPPPQREERFDGYDRGNNYGHNGGERYGGPPPGPHGGGRAPRGGGEGDGMYRARPAYGSGGGGRDYGDGPRW